jgi:hypothetical protein
VTVTLTAAIFFSVASFLMGNAKPSRPLIPIRRLETSCYFHSPAPGLICFSQGGE